MNARTDWKAIAKARGLNIPANDLDLLSGRLIVLEEAFRPLALQLTPDQEPALVFHADVEPQ